MITLQKYLQVMFLQNAKKKFLLWSYLQQNHMLEYSV